MFTGVSLYRVIPFISISFGLPKLLCFTSSVTAEHSYRGLGAKLYFYPLSIYS